MNQLTRNNRSQNHSPTCADLVRMAEQELAAFFRAVRELFGLNQAGLSAEDWLHELTAMNGLPTSAQEWRRLTIKVAAQLASRVEGADEVAWRVLSATPSS